LRSASKRLFVFAGLLAAPASTNVSQALPPPSQTIVDNRLVRLKQFLGKMDCPLNEYAADLIEAADSNALDWRLLPSISVIESSGGKYYMNNNVFGWKSCKERFPSVRDGIQYVAFRLANSDLYREKSLEEVLKTYNPRRRYSTKVKYVMRAISATDLGRVSVN
jgi:hypothetical protein